MSYDFALIDQDAPTVIFGKRINERDQGLLETLAPYAAGRLTDPK